jgi:mRNA interferase MazF
MKEGDIVILVMPQADGIQKKRPVLILKTMPKFNDFLVCGISSQLHQFVKGFDEMIEPDSTNRLKQTSIIRLGFLVVEPQRNIQAKMGSISEALRVQLLNRLADYLME